MKTIEEGAKEFVNAPCGWLCKFCINDKMSCRFYNDKESFKAGAEWMHSELTHWHDPKEELPQRNIDVLVMLRDTYRGGKIHYSVGYINGACWFGDSIGAADDVIGWREIHE